MLDRIIKNARVVDGTGMPFYCADVGIKDGKIAAIEQKLTVADCITDGTGLTLAPGFIDSHGHSDLTVDIDRGLENRVEQGITTEIAGMCGLSAAPYSAEHLADCTRVCGQPHEDARAKLSMRSTYKDYFKELDMPLGASIAMHVGHGAIRAAAMGFANRKPTEDELTHMKRMLQEALEAGALGISFGLIYPPGAYSDIDEMTALCKVVADYGGDFTIHMRSEGAKLVEAVEEALEVARRSGARCIISHHKALGGKANWGKTAQTLELIEQANRDGAMVFCDQYPYTASATGLKSDIPNNMHTLGVPKLMEMLKSTGEPKAELRRAVLEGKTPEERFATTMIGASRSYPHYCGKMLLDVAKEQGLDPCDLLFDMLYKDELASGGIFWGMCEEDVMRVMRYPRCMIGTDGMSAPHGAPGHPRAWATFPRVLGRYVREKGVITLEEAIRKMTSMPAAVYGLNGKGLIRVGMDADLVLFNADTIIDNADYTNNSERCTGLRNVFINGRIVVTDGKFNGKLCGKLIRRTYNNI